MINKCHQYKKREGRDFFVKKESTDFNVGDLVIVTYNGAVEDTAPASLGGVTEIKPLKK